MDAIELSSAFDLTTLQPGRYTARSDTPAYAPLRSLTIVGAAKLAGEHYAPDGVKVVTIDYHRSSKNPEVEERHVGIGPEYFVRELNDYDNWPEKWWREAIQNAVDAGASRIDCRVSKGDGDFFIVECEDNGSGMDEDTLLNKFLMLGGSQKPAVAGATGGFGKAKVLLLFPWITWSIQTRSLAVAGTGGTYAVRRDQPSHKGTILRVAMPSGQSTQIQHALAYIEKCTIPGVQFLVGEKTLRANVRKGKLVETFGDKAEVYYNESATGMGGLLVRINGLFMFNQWLDSSIKGTVFVELLKPSIELLTANRDGFRDWELRRAVDAFRNKLAKDTLSALKGKKNLMRQRYRGTGLFDLQEESKLIAGDLLAGLTTKRTPPKRGAIIHTEISVTEASAEAMAEQLSIRGPGIGEARVDGDKVDMGIAPPQLISTYLSVVHTETQLEHTVEQLAWSPDFLVVNEEEGFRVPKKLLPAGMTPTTLKLAKVWAELCRFVLIQLGSRRRYGVGWIFSRTSAAAFYEFDNEPWILLNPYKNARRFEATSELYNPHTDDLRQLYASAVHEATHMYDGIAYHDESFASALTNNIAQTLPGWKLAKQIVASIKTRAA